MTPLLWEDRAYNEDGGEEEEEAAAEGETFCALPPSLPPPPFKKTGKVRLWGERGGREATTAERRKTWRERSTIQAEERSCGKKRMGGRGKEEKKWA